MPIAKYIANVQKLYKGGHSSEHSFRGNLQNLLNALLPDLLVINEAKRRDCGAPDYILTKGDVPVGFIEAKDLGDADLEGLKPKRNKEQFDRYKKSLDNIVFTDYLRFYFYKNEECTAKISIAEITHKGIRPLKENFEAFRAKIKDFASYSGQSIQSPQRLAELMAAKARLLANIIENALSFDENAEENSSLLAQMESFRRYTIHDISIKSFADVYAQTLCYGMFAARLHDPTLQTFSRQEAYELIPKSNPFLKQLFGYIAGIELDDRIKWVVDDLIRIFLACDVAQILQDYGKSTESEDPIIHFYEDFLSLYDPTLRKTRGVWYTPTPVVQFMVRAVDQILKNDFGLPMGLADTTKTKIEADVQGKKVEHELHRVQILDPATGTGTFLAEVIKAIYKNFEGQEGIWSQYVQDHLLPRLHGFEILMASYAMAHLKLDLLLRETGFKATNAQRLRVFLTNSLEEQQHPDTGTLFASWLSNEANEANRLKRDCPVMVVLGNPPYSGESANKGAWIMDLMQDYKKEPGGVQKLQERNPKWLNDDYVKFIRYGQHYIEKNGSGILAYINPHGYLDNPTFRGMRWNLLQCFDKIYTIDLHGNSKKKETAPDGGIDENVFDITQGVSINFFIKTAKKKKGELGRVFHYDLYGKREFKYDFLNENSIVSIPYKELPCLEPMYFMLPKDFKAQEDYDKGFSVSALFSLHKSGMVTSRDAFVIDSHKDILASRISDFFAMSKSDLQRKYGLKENKRFKIEEVQKSAKQFDVRFVYPILYRPFDLKFVYYEAHFIEGSRIEVMQHFIKGDNVGLALCKQFKSGSDYVHVFIANTMMESSYVSNKTSEITSIFPLYLYPEDGEQQSFNGVTRRRPNLNAEIVAKIAEILGLAFVAEETLAGAEGRNSCFTPLDLLDYIYAVLHSQSYREKYKEFLKIDFPRVPYPEGLKIFWTLVDLGSQLRQVHLLESPVVSQFSTRFPQIGDNVVDKPRFVADDADEDRGRVYMNKTQYFEGVTRLAWEFYIGGYQPAQKWLKDRKGLILGFDDILHYQKMIAALNETARLMALIDELQGWSI
ncbi:MAG: type ISP restriction/modification enzyme [Bradymonadales bacterium]